MAYQNFGPWEGEALSPVSSPIDAVAFSPVELRVIGLGERVDVARERRADGLVSRLLQWAFGLSPARPLADPHLEALRRFASKARHHAEALVEEDVRALVAAGYTVGQVYGLSGYLAARQQSGAARA